MNANTAKSSLSGIQNSTGQSLQNAGSKKFAKSLELQRLEMNLDMRPFISYAHKILSAPIIESSSDSSDNDNLTYNDKIINGIKSTKQERRNDKLQIYNFTRVDAERKWLQNSLLSDTESESEFSDEDEYIKDMLKTHLKEQKLRKKFYMKTSNNQYTYYGAGLLSNYDQFPDHQRSIVGVKKRRKERERKIKEKPSKKQLKKQQQQHQNNIKLEDLDPNELADLEWDEMQNKDDFDDDTSSQQISSTNRGRKKKGLIKTPEMMAARRRKIWQLMAKKEVGKIQRSRANNHKEILQGCKRVAAQCMKVARQKAMYSQKIMKEQIWRAKRLTREMQTYWKRYDRVERETRKRMEKEAEEQRKLDVEIIEAKRQQRKLNFLITQTELYAHFMSKKLGHGTEEEQMRILKQLDEEVNPRLASLDDYDPFAMKNKAQQNAADAFNTERARTQEFDVIGEPNPVLPTLLPDGEIELPQPDIFRGTLKIYQIKGMTWLANLYDQGISGILADEMGLGKTVQSIALLCHIAERYGVWGPFLIISPASTLHNWQQEMSRFVPCFNVVPYWGSPNERKILRQFWEQKDLHTKDASFHVVITSYQLVVSDYKYFNRIKWQYMILDEAQAIKSTSSMRWKMLLGFNCRNRLLLSGTPIQNSMAELWALLHFIMPTLFDSHDEFNEWFSKDIESHAENKTGIDEKQISRLHMILKPFMLRRIKADVENELSDKIEIMVFCPLTIRQKLLYMALKKKIRIEDLLHCVRGAEGQHQSVDKNFTSNLMNLVMQFRKVCNHPELFERRDAKSPFSMKLQEYCMPRLIFNDGILYNAIPSKKHLLYNKLSIFTTENVHRSLFPKRADDKLPNYSMYEDLNQDNCFSFTRFANLSPNSVEKLTLRGLISLYLEDREIYRQLKSLAYRRFWWKNYDCSEKRLNLLEPTVENILNKYWLPEQSILAKFLFISCISTFYTFGTYTVLNMQETIEHRIIRSKYLNQRNLEQQHIVNENKAQHFEDDQQLPCSSFVTLANSPVPGTPGRGRPPKHSLMTSEKNLSPIKCSTYLVPELPFVERPSVSYFNQQLEMPKFLFGIYPKVQAYGRRLYVESRAGEWSYIRHQECESTLGKELILDYLEKNKGKHGWSWIQIPDKQTLISDAGKLAVLDNLLMRLKLQGHRVLIYSQMTKMIDLLEEYMWHRKYRYMRLDGSSKISARRDMVDDFQTRSDIFVFLLSTRAGGLGINLTAADTVIFYDSDWNPTVDQQAMDRAHRLGQTKQVTVYRLICKGTIEERILQRAREKSEIQRMVISGGNFKPDTLKPKEVVSLLLDDEEIEVKYRQKTDEKKPTDDKSFKDTLVKRKNGNKLNETTTKKIKLDCEDDSNLVDVEEQSPEQSECGGGAVSNEGIFSGSYHDEDTSNEGLIVDIDSPFRDNTPVSFSHYGAGRPRRKHHPRGTRRGRPRGSGRGGKVVQITRQDTSPHQSTSNAPSSNNGDQLIESGESSFQSTIPSLIKRGPGRPRLKQCIGPPNQGYRGSPRTRKPIGPLLVPIGHSPAVTPLNRSPAISPTHSSLAYQDDM